MKLSILLDTSFIDDLYGKLIPNLFSFLVQLIALVVLALVVILVAYKPVKKMLKKRQDFIENNISESTKNNCLANENLANSKRVLLETNDKANLIISDAKKQAIIEQEKIKEETALEIKKMKQDAQNEIIQMRKDAEESVRKEIIDIAILASSKLLDKNISSEDNERIVEDFIKEIKD